MLWVCSTKREIYLFDVLLVAWRVEGISVWTVYFNIGSWDGRRSCVLVFIVFEVV